MPVSRGLTRIDDHTLSPSAYRDLIWARMDAFKAAIAYDYGTTRHAIA